MKLKYTLATALTIAAAPAHAEIYNYSCEVCVFPGIVSESYQECDVVNGKTYPLRIDDSKKVLEWRGKKYNITEQPNCAKYGWHAEGNGTSFEFCTATKGYGAIIAKLKAPQEGTDEVRVQCNLKR